MSKVLIYISFIIIFIIVLSLWQFYLVIRPYKIVSTNTPKTYEVDYESVQFKTSDNVLIKGWFIPTKNPQAKTIILLHGYPADKGDILPSRLFLHKKYNLLFLDFRYLGQSEGNYSTVGAKEVLALQAALQYLAKRGIAEVGVWGLSLGGAVAILGSHNTPQVKAIVAEASFARLDWMADDYNPIPGLNYVMGQLFRIWGRIFLNIDISSVNPVDYIEKIKVPILLTYSKTDTVVPYRHALIMQEVGKNNPLVTIVVLENLQHGGLIDNYQDVIQHFFDKNL